MKNVLICGAGMSATDLIFYMLEHAEEYKWEVTVGDILVEISKKKIDGHPRGRAVYFDSYDAEIMERYIKDVDIVISLLPPGMQATASIGAKLILNGEIKSRGVLFPWSKEVYDPILDELEEPGIAYASYDNKIEHSKFD